MMESIEQRAWEIAEKIVMAKKPNPPFDFGERISYQSKPNKMTKHGTFIAAIWHSVYTTGPQMARVHFDGNKKESIVRLDLVKPNGELYA